MWEQQGAVRATPRTGGWIPLILTGLIILAAFYSYVLFHTLAELFSVMVAVLVAVVVWQAHVFSRNDFLMYLACGYFWVGALDLVHTLTNHGMTVFPFDATHHSIQVWVGARYVEALLLLTAPFFLTRPLSRGASFTAYGFLSLLLLGLIMSGRFPVAYVEGKGLTPFKVWSEYLIIGLLFAASVHLWRRRAALDSRILALMQLSIAFTIMAEFMFTLYLKLRELPVVVGHVFKLLSYWLIFVAVVRTALREPFRLLARGASTYDAVPDPTIVIDRDGFIRKTNRAAREAAGLSEEVCLGRHCHDIFHPPELPLGECPVCRLIDDCKSARTVEIEFKNSDRWHQITLSPIGISEETQGTVHVSRDVTERRSAEETLRHSEGRLAEAQRIARLGNWEWDIALDRVNWSEELFRIFGIEPDGFAATRQAYLDRVHPEDRSYVEDRIQAAVTKGKPYRVEYRIVRPDGSVRFVRGKGRLDYDAGGRPVRMYGIAQDITERKRAEQFVQDSERRYRTLLNHLPLAVFMKDVKGFYVSCNQNYAADLGITPEKIAGKTDFDFHPHPLAEKYRADDQRVIESGEKCEIEEPYVRQGQELVVRTLKAPVMDEAEQVVGVLGIFWDITEQKRGQEILQMSEARYRAIVEDQTEFVVRFVPGGGLTFVNEVFSRYVGVSGKQLIGRSLLAFVAESDRAQVERRLTSFDCASPVGGLEYGAALPDGGRRFHQWTCRAICDEYGRVVEYQATGRDITERKVAEEGLHRALNEKEALLREVHHRVKNNMQVVSSLLGLEANRTADTAAATLFRDAESRIRSMSLVHERLYRCEDLCRIDFDGYVRDLISHLARAYPSGSRVQFAFDIEDLPISIDYAIPYGLVVNELTSNALKHAFTEDRQGTISIRARRLTAAIELIVADDGIGFPEGVGVTSFGSLGLRLVKQLVENQLQGSIELVRDVGTCWRITVDNNEKKAGRVV